MQIKIKNEVIFMVEKIFMSSRGILRDNLILFYYAEFFI